MTNYPTPIPRLALAALATLAATYPSWLLVLTPTHAEVSSPEGTVRYVAKSEPVGVAS